MPALAPLQNKESAPVWICDFVFEKNESLMDIFRQPAGDIRHNSANSSPVHGIQDKNDIQFVFHRGIMCPIPAIKKRKRNGFDVGGDYYLSAKRPIRVDRQSIGAVTHAGAFQVNTLSSSGRQIR